MIFIRVDLPAPFSPTIARISPGCRSTEMSSSTVTEPYFWPTPRSESTARRRSGVSPSVSGTATAVLSPTGSRVFRDQMRSPDKGALLRS